MLAQAPSYGLGKTATPDDVVYMDPPYQGVCTNRDPRYISLLGFEEFCETLHGLNRRGISFVLSYDGKTGEKSHGKPMPADLGLIHIEIDAGRSSQATLLGRTHKTYESLYFSPAPDLIQFAQTNPAQWRLFDPR